MNRRAPRPPFAPGPLFARPGELDFFANTYAAGITHVGIYIGYGQFVDAQSERTGVRIKSLASGYRASHFAGVRRMR